MSPQTIHVTLKETVRKALYAKGGRRHTMSATDYLMGRQGFLACSGGPPTLVSPGLPQRLQWAWEHATNKHTTPKQFARTLRGRESLTPLGRPRVRELQLDDAPEHDCGEGDRASSVDSSDATLPGGAALAPPLHAAERVSCSWYFCSSASDQSGRVALTHVSRFQMSRIVLALTPNCLPTTTDLLVMWTVSAGSCL